MTVLKDGFSTTVAFANYPSIALEMKEVTPPGMEGGGPNDTTTMSNTAYRTRYPKNLKTLSQMSFSAAYDPAVYDDIVDAINVNQLITVTFPNGDTLAFWGWLDSFKPGSAKEGDQPTADVVIEPSNLNGSEVETAPVLTEA